MIDPEIIQSVISHGGTGIGGLATTFLILKFLVKRKNGTNGTNGTNGEDRRKTGQMEIENMLLKRDNEINTKITLVKDELEKVIGDHVEKLRDRMDQNKTDLLAAINNIGR